MSSSVPFHEVYAVYYSHAYASVISSAFAIVDHKLARQSVQGSTASISDVFLQAAEYHAEAAGADIHHGTWRKEW